MAVNRVNFCFPNGKRKALTMSYDDGKLPDRRLVSILNTYGIRATFHLNYGPISRRVENRIPAEQIAALYRGHEVACHGLNHSSADRCPIAVQAAQLLKERRGLEALTGGLVRGYAYPNGICTDSTKALLPQLGIAYARIWERSHSFDLPRDFYAWAPTCHHADPDFPEIVREFAALRKDGYLSVMTAAGHSYEFELDDSWHRIEECCALLGGREDIWYTTCIEIADYMTAAHSLRFTADYQAVYNPSDRSVWLEADGQILEVPSGGFLRL